MQKEYTWVKPLVKGQPEIQIKVLKDASNRQNKQFQVERFETFDYTNDAIFESFRDYPRKKQLYRKHKDIAKDYERKVKFYRSCQRWYSVETKRQMHTVGERFCNLLKHTFDTTENRSNRLQNSYNLWFANRNTSSDKTSNKGVGNLDQNRSEETLEHLQTTNTSPSTSRHDKRLHSLRSVSVDNIPEVEEQYRANGLTEKMKFHEELTKSCMNLTHTHI